MKLEKVDCLQVFAVIQGWRDGGVYTREVKIAVSERERNEHEQYGVWWRWGEKDHFASRCINPPWTGPCCPHTVLAATVGDRTEKDEAGFVFRVLHDAQHPPYTRQSMKNNHLAHNVCRAIVLKLWCLIECLCPHKTIHWSLNLIDIWKWVLW